LVRRTPIKVSSLRGLGGPPNIFAAECFVDELAEAAGVDPLRYRLQMQSDPRAIAVLERTARLCDWSRRASLPENQGLGLAYDRHRDRAAYCAVACELHVDEAVRLDHLWCVADCGLIINPDGARNQLEGGMIMAASWALKEEVKLGGNGITSLTWNDYPILRFDEVPEIDVELIVPPGAPPWGAGEISQGATMAAIGNALAQALGTRVRSMPFSRERLAEALIRD
jgi:CO/xanthine dehydrogenase Mo-binding subunit